MSDTEALARRVIDGVQSLSVKLAELKPDIEQLWHEFETLPAGQTIVDCHSKTEFCEKHLHRTLRAVQYMLSGGNQNRRENVSRVAPAYKRDDDEKCLGDDAGKRLDKFADELLKAAHSTANLYRQYEGTKLRVRDKIVISIKELKGVLKLPVASASGARL